MEFDWLDYIYQDRIESLIDKSFYQNIFQREVMTELQTDISSLYDEMENFFRSQARNESARASPLTLRTEYKNSLKLTDLEKNVFEVDQSFLSNFRNVYIDKAYKVVRLNNWEFEIKFQGKKCLRIDLISESVTFLASKTAKHEISACHFKIPIVESQAALKKLSPEMLGYLNRLGKQNLCKQSYNVCKEMKSLLSFASLKTVKVQTFNYKPWNKSDSNGLNALSTLSQDGRKVLEKLSHFITRQQVNDFIIQKEASDAVISELRDMLSVKK